ncbi:hypothetical protein [Roseimaritima ulvae]|uniref:Uncharacterized protein n=1 Tax=Roseimaritima ulvae TaxID=980254 RepID=A0A5B9QJD2_9BACT|nr:hypothetical protein [Roseimaritima ulvae]QEG39227.1 hypothetical protein UC8_11880 [Roseimaritima ulvae]
MKLAKHVAWVPGPCRSIASPLRTAAAIALLLACIALPVSAATADQAPVLLTVKRGLTAQLTFTHPSDSLRALPDQSTDAAVLVRLERTGPAQDNAAHRYTLWFFGTVAGQYDLSQWVVQKDGSPLTSDQALPPMPVRVVSDLPPGHGTSLYEIDDPLLRAQGGYRAALIGFACLWAAVPIVWGFVRLRSRKPQPAAATAPPPTLSDRLRPLVQRASQGQLTVEEQSRLEILLYVFWQRRLGLPDSLAEALPVLRRHHEAGGLLRSLEAWIHADGPPQASLSPTTMDALLAPYHAEQASIEAESALQTSKATVGGTA